MCILSKHLAEKEHPRSEAGWLPAGDVGEQAYLTGSGALDVGKYVALGDVGALLGVDFY